MKTRFIIIFLFISLQNISSQPLTIWGKISDSISSKPVMYVNIGVKRLGIGTITNKDGDFVLKINNYNRYDSLTISCIGYKNKKLSLQKLSNTHLFQLMPDTVSLNEVVIMPDSTLLTLLRRAYRKIPENYPQNPTRLKGFYREALKSEDSIFLYFVEAIIDVYKNDYKKARSEGQIKIEKSRKKIFPGIDSINAVRFYGGPYFPIIQDFVYQRQDFINPKKFDKYTYNLTSTVKYNNKTVYVISFSPKDSINPRGTLYIDKESLAYIAFEVNMSKEYINEISINSYKRGNRIFKINYIEFDHKYFLGNILFSAEGYNTKTKKHLGKKIEYATTFINTDSVKPIPPDEMFDFRDILSIKATDYDSSDWKDYNILADSQIKEQSAKLYYSENAAREYLTKKYNQNKHKSYAFYRFVSKLTFDVGISCMHTKMTSGVYDLNYINNTSLNFSKTLNIPKYIISLYWRYSYELTKKSLVNFSGIESNNYNSYGLGYMYKIIPFPGYQCWTLDLCGTFAYSSLLFSLGEINSPTDIKIGDKSFGAKKITAYIGQKNYSLKPSITLTYKGKGLLGFFLQTSFDIAIYKQQAIRFNETSGFFLTRMQQWTNLNNGNPRLSYNGSIINTINLKTYPLQIEAGLKIGF